MIVDGVTLRPAVAADAPVIERVARDGFVATFGTERYSEADLREFFDASMSAARYAAAADDAELWLEVAEENGAIAGFALAAPSTQGVAGAARPWELKQLYLAPSLQGRGVADAMLGHVIDNARRRGCDAVELSVFSENHRAQRFYARHGFAEVAKIIFMVGATEDDDRLWRRTL